MRAGVMRLADAALAVLTTADPMDKVRRTQALAADWREGRITEIGAAAPPDRPARPARPELRPPRDMPKRRKAGSTAGRVALLHALAHIELNAIDLAWDLIARFTGHDLPQAFYDDWVTVADDEARHFEALARRMADFGAAYGDLPAHDGLWLAARETAHDPAARLAVVPMVLEARALDLTPNTVDSLRAAGDAASAALLHRIAEEEIGHVAAGHRWFVHLCRQRGEDPVATWQALVRRHFKGQLKRPFNLEGRGRAGFPPEFYEPLAEG